MKILKDLYYKSKFILADYLPGHGAVSHSSTSVSNGAGHIYPPFIGGIHILCLYLSPVVLQLPTQSLQFPQAAHSKFTVSGPISLYMYLLI